MSTPWNAFKNLFNTILWYFGFEGPKIKRHDAALKLLAEVRGNAQKFESLGPPANPGTAWSRTDGLLLARQLMTLERYIDRHGLLSTESHESGLGHMASEIHANRITDPIAARLDAVGTLLHIQRALDGGVSDRAVPKGNSVPASTRSTSVPIADGDTVATASAPSEKTDTDESAILWKTTEKLYESWPLKLLGVLLVGAIVLASSGTILIGSKAIELKKTLEEAGTRETKSFEEFAKNTRESVNRQKDDVLSSLDRQQGEINRKMEIATKQIQDLEGRSDAIKNAAISKAVEEIRSSFSNTEKTLREKLEDSLSAVKTGDLKRLQENIARVIQQVDEFSASLSYKTKLVTDSDTKLRTVVEFANNADILKQRLDTIAVSKAKADDELNKIVIAEVNVTAALERISGSDSRVAAQVERQQNKIMEHQGVLGGHDASLTSISERLRTMDVTSERTGKTLKDAALANSVLDGLTSRLDRLTKTADDLDKRIKPPPVVTPPPPPPPTVLNDRDLTLEQWRAIQNSLKARNLFRYAVDGKPGNRTRAAIKEYQRDRKEPDSGILTSVQIKALLSAAPP